ncbi:MAG: poly-beta-1,6 N-acetyl-D-glucosamine synthase [Ectothiorhodospiraceae bacterium]|nr:poly-beta-1,6 N-acetyl-D-glucosamine synthase [Ectothiorhodospiraceae bacterium]
MFEGFQLILEFAFYYPLFMAYLWMVGGVYYYLHWERSSAGPQHPPALDRYPLVSLVIPCHNEADHLHETIHYALGLDYPDYEVIAVDDGSTDATGAILDALAREHPRLRVVHLRRNQGKAMGLRTAALVARSEFLVCIDGDAVLDRHALTWMMSHFLAGPRVGAVTGNPRIRNRSTLLGRIQVGEFSSIVGLIKRAQRVYGRVFTVSGVVAAFRRSALHDVGYWSPDMVTEDIDISWKLQLAHWDVRFEPNALCWILMPETLRGLWKQRLRWAQGGVEVMLKFLPRLGRWRLRRMWPVCIELVLSIGWAYVMAGIVALWLVGQVVTLPPDLVVRSIIPGWNGVLLGLTCLAQFALSLAIDSRYERRLARMLFWVIWYPMVYWVLGAAASVVGVVKAITKPRGTRAVWTSPDRGLRATGGRGAGR